MRIAILELKLADNVHPVGWEEHEIIDIKMLICELLTDGITILNSYQASLEPTKKSRSQLDERCEFDLVNSNAAVDKATLENILPDLLAELERFAVSAWCTWGIGNSLFIIECRVKGLNNIMKNFKFFDIHKLFSEIFGMRINLKRALEVRGLTNNDSFCKGPWETNSIVRLLENEERLRSAILRSCKKMGQL